MRKLAKFLSGIAVVVAVLAAGPAVRIAFDWRVQAADWRTASTAPVGWAPDPGEYTPAVVQVYAAPTVGWRGTVGDHTWIAAKAAGATHYRRYEVIGFRLARTGSAVVETDTATPDQRWYGSPPKLLQDIRGPEAEKIVDALPAVVEAYPHRKKYRVWPGPNSNTFVAYVAREIPEMRLTLPGKALGKDYLMGAKVLDRAPSGTGIQFSLGGVLGLLVAWQEGIEVNVLGLVFGADPMSLAITLPGVGRIPARADWTGGRHQSEQPEHLD